MNLATLYQENLKTLVDAVDAAIAANSVDVMASFDVWDDDEGNDPETSLCFGDTEIKLGDNYLALRMNQVRPMEATLAQWKAFFSKVTISAKGRINLP